MTDVTLRDLRYSDIQTAAHMVEAEWPGAGTRAFEQMVAMFTTNPNRPHFYVAVHEGTLIGMCGFEPSMLMKGAYSLIWLVLAESARGKKLGTQLTTLRINEIVKRGGKLVGLMTQKPGFFRKQGFLPVCDEMGDAEDFDGWTLMTRRVGTISI